MDKQERSAVSCRSARKIGTDRSWDFRWASDPLSDRRLLDMMKNFLFFLLLVSVGWPVATHADTATVNDEAGLFTTDQIQSLEQQAEKLNEKSKDES